MKKKINAIILAAGRGRRLKNISHPKCLIKINQKLLLENLINNFKSLEINNINIVVGYKKEKIIKKFQKYNFLFNKKWKNTNMFYTLKCADKLLKKNYSIISYADIYYNSSAIKLILNKKYDICITSFNGWNNLWKKRFKNPLNDLETFDLDKNKYLTEIGKKTKNIKNIKGQYMGVIGISPRGWIKLNKCISYLSKNILDKISMTELLEILLKEKIKIKVIPYKEKFMEIDYLNDLKLARKLFKKRK
tara:strand:- start:4298 stop:5041 length:744 start_codon:yes stop_codon:yes gene_type:complete